MKIKAIFVDLGGVLIINKAKEVGEKYDKDYGLTLEMTRNIFRFIQTAHRTKQEVVEYLKEENINPELWIMFTKELYGSESRNDELIDLLFDLKSKDIKIIFTTNNADNLTKGIEKYQLQGLADLIINSSEHRAAKPDKEYWEVAFSETKKIIPDLSKDEVFVIDDSGRNCESAKDFGFNVYKYSNSTDSEDNILKIIFKDKIYEKDGVVHHESAGGFLFYNDPKDGLLVALVKKIDGSYWMTKGHIQEEETSEEAATRELMEELSLNERPLPLKKVGVESYSFSLPNDTRKHFKDVHVFIFEAKEKVKLSNEVTKTISGEKGRFDNPEWLSVPDAIEKLNYDREILRKSVFEYLSLKNDKI